MTWVSLKSLMERRTRAILTAMAIVLGVAMIAGSLILTDTIDRAFTDVFGASYTKTDLVVRGTPVVEDSFAGAPTVPASLLPRIQSVPGVAEAGGNLVDFSGSGNTAKMLDKDGTVITGSNPSFGFGIDPSHPRFTPLTLSEGAWAAGPGQVVVNQGTASAHGFHVGDTVRIVAEGPAQTFTITGLAKFGDLDSLGGATIAVFDVPTARTVLGKTGFDLIQIAADPGVSQAELASRIAPLLPQDAQVQTGDEQAAADKAVVSEAITFIRGILLAFGGIALFVGAFVIFNTLSITVAQRSRELATLRTLGASRRQVLRSVIAEAAIIGVVASLVGLALGWFLASGLTALFGAMGLDMPQGDTVFATSTVVIALLAGTVVTLLAGVVPAIRATRVPPIAAVREGATTSEGTLSRRSAVVALAATALAGAALARGLLAGGLGTGERMTMIGAGVLALFIGVATVSSRLVRPIAALVGWPIARTGAAGALARENAVRNPARTASTAAALMIGLALVTFVSVLGSGLTDTAKSDVTQQISASHVVTSKNGWDPSPIAAGRAIAAGNPGAVVSSVREDQARVNGSGTAVDGVDPGTIAGVYRFTWVERLRPLPRHARRRRRDRHGDVRRRPRPDRRLPRPHPHPVRRAHDAHRRRDHGPALPHAGAERRPDLPAGVRRRLPAAEGHPHARLRRATPPRSSGRWRGSPTPRSTPRPATPWRAPRTSPRSSTCCTSCWPCPWWSACSGWSTPWCWPSTSAPASSGCCGRSG